MWVRIYTRESSSTLSMILLLTKVLSQNPHKGQFLSVTKDLCNPCKRRSNKTFVQRVKTTPLPSTFLSILEDFSRREVSSETN